MPSLVGLGVVDLPRGATVTRKRPIGSDVPKMLTTSNRGSAGRDRGVALSPAEQRALRRSAPLSTAQFKAVGHLVERGDLPLRRLLRRHHTP